MGMDLNTKLFLQDLKNKGEFRSLRSVIELGSQDDMEQGDRAFETFKANGKNFELDVLSGKVCAGGGVFYS
ncbi:hypothetical protein [Helicobacter sp.]|uniref:hypothetical protein n=1 Tax=Helicobacter sp. TaxID=218 RepID=UPI0025BEFDD8|nr:hypothetical protein [Helicobacter sp.]MCI5968984.1 hypothetical protein [Helicobacter sp.]